MDKSGGLLGQEGWDSVTLSQSFYSCVKIMGLFSRHIKLQFVGSILAVSPVETIRNIP